MGITRISARTMTLLIAVSLSIGILSALLAYTLKHITEYFEKVMAFRTVQYPVLVWIFPLIGLSLIYLLRQNLFRKKQNKGITEVFDSINTGNRLPSYKITSHFINGFVTVVFGGSTGIEVATVVSTAAIGSNAGHRQTVLREYKDALVCAGIAAGITVLFSSPLAGILFCLEVISRKRNAVFFIVLLSAILPAVAVLYGTHEEALLSLPSFSWHYHAIPYFLLVALFAALNSIYLTKSVLTFKKNAAMVSNPIVKIVVGSLLISLLLFLFPTLYGDSYAAIKDMMAAFGTQPLTMNILLFMAAILVLKPVIVSLTLASGGDGGVFAPSLVTGAFTGLIFAVVANHYGANLIPVNFMLAGMAGVLSASIAAPLTAAFLVCGICGSYFLLLPLLLVSFISRLSARMIFADTVYSYRAMKA